MGETRTSPSTLQRRRQEVLERYLAGDPIEVICREMGCAKSWLYKSLVSGNSGDFSLSKAVGWEDADAFLPPMPLHTLGQMRRHRHLFP